MGVYIGSVAYASAGLFPGHPRSRALKGVSVEDDIYGGGGCRWHGYWGLAAVRG